MSYNKVVYDGETLIDLTSDTVTAETLAKGATAHSSSGDIITGTMTPGVSSWNDLTDKPFGDNVTHPPITFNPDTDITDDSVWFEPDFIKVSDSTFSVEDLIGGTLEITGPIGDSIGGKLALNAANTFVQFGAPMVVVNDTPVVVIMTAEEAASLGVDSGTYFVCVDDVCVVTSLSLPERYTKIDPKYLPDMGSSGSGSCGIEYWTGDVTWDSTSNTFTLHELNLQTGEEVEFAIRLNEDSAGPVCTKYSFIYGSTNVNHYMSPLEDAHNTRYPRADLVADLVYDDYDRPYVHKLRLRSSTETDAVSISNPQILFVRVYRMS